MIVPMLTPLTPGGGIDLVATRYLTEYLIAERADALFLLGSTGEGDSLTFEMQYEFGEAVARHARGRVPLLLGAMQPSTQTVIAFLKGCRCLDAFCAVVAGVPYYRALTCESEVLAHFRMIHASIGKPVVVYNLPHATSRVLTPAVVSAVLELEGIVGFKDSSGSREIIRHLAGHRSGSRTFAMYQGDPAQCLASLQDGADGVIVGPGNFIPFAFKRLCDAYYRGDLETAARGQELVLRFRQFARVPTPFTQGGFHFSTFKAGLEVMGFGGGTPAAPYQPLPAEYLKVLRPYFEEANVLEHTGRFVASPNKVVVTTAPGNGRDGHESARRGASGVRL
jgi:4-hydroxy-tetrahydrodipicolinate synthase